MTKEIETVSKEDAKLAVFGSNDICILEAVIGLLETNPFRTQEARKLSDKIILDIKATQQKVLRRCAPSMRRAGI